MNTISAQPGQAGPRRLRGGRFPRRVPLRELVALLMLLAILLTRPASATEVFHSVVGYSGNTFMNTDKESAQAIARLWTGLVAKRRGGTADTRILGSLAEMDREISLKRLDLLILLSSEYLELKQRTLLEPLFVSSKKEDINDRLVLVVRRNGTIRALNDLRGKVLLQQRGVMCEGRNLWLDTLLMRGSVRDPQRFFSPASQLVMKPYMAVMPVFFGKADACVVTRSSLKTMGELNPQLQRDLLVLAESPPRPGSVIAVRRGLAPAHRELLRQILGTLDRDAQGRQLLTLFHMNSLVPFRDDYLEPLERLYREYHSLRRS